MTDQSSEVLEVSILEIFPKENSRQDYPENEMAELMTSMRQHGQLHPIGLSRADVGFDLVFGNRRYQAAKKLGWKKIEAKILEDGISDERMITLNAVENMVRQDVPAAHQGRLFQKLLDDGLEVKEIAARVGVGEQKVKNCLELYRDVPEELREKVVFSRNSHSAKKSGNIPAAVALEIGEITKAKKLDPARSMQLWQECKKRKIGRAQMRVVAEFLDENESVADAVEKASKYKRVTVTLLVPPEVADRAMRTGKTPTKIGSQILCDSDVFQGSKPTFLK